jgi:hypothetical protein
VTSTRAIITSKNTRVLRKARGVHRIKLDIKIQKDFTCNVMFVIHVWSVYKSIMYASMLPNFLLPITKTEHTCKTIRRPNQANLCLAKIFAGKKMKRGARDDSPPRREDVRWRRCLSRGKGPHRSLRSRTAGPTVCPCPSSSLPFRGRSTPPQRGPCESTWRRSRGMRPLYQVRRKPAAFLLSRTSSGHRFWSCFTPDNLWLSRTSNDGSRPTWTWMCHCHCL